MPIMNSVGLGETEEAGLAPEASYDLRILGAEPTSTKAALERAEASGDEPVLDMVRCRIGIEGSEIPYMPINYWLTLAQEVDKERILRNGATLYDLKNQQTMRFLAAFGVESNGDSFDSDDLDGATASNILVKEGAPNEETGEVYNEIVLPRSKAA